jgi:hypothetical protein
MKDFEIKINIDCLIYNRRYIKDLEKEILRRKVVIEKTLQELKDAGVKTEFEKTWRKENK